MPRTSTRPRARPGARRSRQSSSRLAELCRPKHAAAVRQIAKAVETLSAAVQTERAVRAGLADVGALHALPDAGFEFGTLAEYESLLSRWNRRMLQAGLL